MYPYHYHEANQPFKSKHKNKNIFIMSVVSCKCVFYPTRCCQVRPFSVPSIYRSWHLFLFCFFKTATRAPLFTMILRRSQRIPRPKTIWEEEGAPSAARDPKITKQAARTEKKTALKPIAIGPLSGLDEKRLPELPTYKLPLKLRFELSESRFSALKEHVSSNVIAVATVNSSLLLFYQCQDNLTLKGRTWQQRVG
jgi:hypothetical protein